MKPCVSPTAALSATTDDVCELGIPPELVISRKLIVLCRSMSKMILIICAANQDVIAANRILF